MASRRINHEQGRAAPSVTPAPIRKRGKARQFWSKQLHTWHWISAAVSLAGMLVFSVTGLTLNHAASISAEPDVRALTASIDWVVEHLA